MEQMPHHREGIQNELDKAYDEGHQDNRDFDEGQAKIVEAKADEIAHKEYGGIGDKEARSSLSLEETVALLKENGYLDTSFEGKETHSLAMRALSKEEALEEYKNSGGETSMPDKLEMDMPYVTPKEETLDVMIMNLYAIDDCDNAVAVMDTLGVRPLTYAELIQYGIAYPNHQGEKSFAGLGTWLTTAPGSISPALFSPDATHGSRIGFIYRDDGLSSANYNCPVVRK